MTTVKVIITSAPEHVEEQLRAFLYTNPEAMIIALSQVALQSGNGLSIVTTIIYRP